MVPGGSDAGTLFTLLFANCQLQSLPSQQTLTSTRALLKLRGWQVRFAVDVVTVDRIATGILGKERYTTDRFVDGHVEVRYQMPK